MCVNLKEICEKCVVSVCLNLIIYVKKNELHIMKIVKIIEIICKGDIYNVFWYVNKKV